MAVQPDFAGYVTKFGIKCSDGRTIMAHAFQGLAGTKVPLVWMHQHQEPDNVLGHVLLTSRPDGVWGEGYFNDTDKGQHAKKMVAHKDVNGLSIYANGLKQQAMSVVHGIIREVSLVLAGANPGAFIQNVNVVHADGEHGVLEDEVVIFSPEQDLAHASTNIPGPTKVGLDKGPMPPVSDPPAADEPDGNDMTVQDVLDSMTEEQRQVTYGLIGAASADAAQSATSGDDPAAGHNDSGKGDNPVTGNVFDQSARQGTGASSGGAVLTHSDIREIFADAQKGGSLKGAVEAWAFAHGIDSIDTLFPYDQAVTDTPEFISRRTEWVQGVLSATRKTPFARIRSWTADITFPEARAKGYVKGNLKKEEFLRIARRITTPQTVYKKQKLERDDIIDITEFDVVQWLQTEMRLMLDEELARAILIGDGRDADAEDKINTENVRPIYGDDSLYVTQVSVEKTAITTSADTIVDNVVTAMRFYRGSGTPVLYTTRIWLAKLQLIKDTLGRRLYPTMADLTAALGVSDVIACEALEAAPELIGLVVNLQDYTCGTDRGGEVSMFDFFDIDYNQQKYLMETRMSGAMTKYRGALALVATDDTLLPDPEDPTFDSTTGVGTIPDATGLHYTYVTVADDGTESSALTAGAQTAIVSGDYVTYRAVPATDYEFSTDNFQWTFRRD